MNFHSEIDISKMEFETIDEAINFARKNCVRIPHMEARILSNSGVAIEYYRLAFNGEEWTEFTEHLYRDLKIYRQAITLCEYLNISATNRNRFEELLWDYGRFGTFAFFCGRSSYFENKINTLPGKERKKECTNRISLPMRLLLYTQKEY